MLNVIDVLDEHLMLTKLPTFVARKLDRMTPFRTDELDMCMAVQRISTLEKKVALIATQCVELASSAARNAKVTTDKATLDHSLEVARDPKPVSAVVNQQQPSGSRWADMARELTAADFRNQSLQPRSQPSHIIRGSGRAACTGPGQTSVKAVPRRITAFVGRLHIGTTEEELCELLTSAGISEVKCKKLVAKGERVFVTAAFMVSCSIVCAETFYKPDIWPAGAELRDWVFYEKKG